MSALKDILKEFDAHTILRDAISLTGLDISFANFLQSHQATSDTRHLWLAALTSHQWGRGHACLDLAALETHGTQLLGCSKQQLDGRFYQNIRSRTHWISNRFARRIDCSSIEICRSKITVTDFC